MEPEIVRGELVESLEGEQVVKQLADFGLSPDILAAALNMDVKTVRGIIRSTTTTHELGAEDEVIANKMRRLADRCIAKAHELLEYGTTEVQLRIIGQVVPAAARLMGQSGADTVESGRAELNRIYAAMRGDDAVPPS